MNTHDYLVSEDIYVPLHKWHWFLENIITCSNQVNKKALMIPDNAKDSLIVACSLLREELNDNSDLGVWLDGANSLAKSKDVRAIRIKLESSWLITIIYDIQKSICCLLNLNFTKMNRSVAQINVVA